MSMWEIDDLLTRSIALIRTSDLNKESKKHLIRSLEDLPGMYDFDAGGFEKTELSYDFLYQDVNPYEIGINVAVVAVKVEDKALIYDWSAFLLNFWSEYFSKTENLEHIKSDALGNLKTVFSRFNFDDYQPIHASLTIYPDGNEQFSEEQNELIKWYCN